MKKIIIFDFDGVILDSVNIKTEAFKELFKYQNKKIQRQIIKYHLKNGGISRIKKFKYFYKHFLKEKLTKKKINDLSKKFNEIVFKKIIKCKFIIGAKEFLSGKKKYDLFISSGTPESELKLICKKRNLRNFFLNIYGSPKSKIQHINLIKKKYSKLATFIFVGDSENDLYAAMKTKIDFIQVGNNIKKKSKKIIKIRNLRKLNSKILKL